MKIGILTYHRSHNYGALFQALALKTYIENTDNDVSFIDYFPDYHAENYKLLPYFSYLSLKNKIKVFIRLVFVVKKTKRRREKYFDFIRSVFALEDDAVIKDAEQLRHRKYDLVIYGSDQIWRKQNFPSYKEFNPVYFGDFVQATTKIAYAASMGKLCMEEKDKEQVKKYLHNFDAIAVRENELKDYLSDLTEQSLKVVLDPVFLLEKKQWEDICNLRANGNEKYLLFYNIMKSYEEEKIVESIAQTLSLKVYEIRGRVYPFNKKGRLKYQDAGPKEFLNLLYNASFVVATSFHGVAFSVLFNKPFIATGMKNNAGRVQSLLENVTLSDRYVNSLHELPANLHIEYTQVNEKLQHLRVDSKNYLDSYIK